MATQPKKDEIATKDPWAASWKGIYNLLVLLIF
jgi:hypothetical protein